MSYTIYLDADSSVTDNTAKNGSGGGINVKSLRDYADHIILLNGTAVLNNFPDDIHSNETGLVFGSISTDAILTGNPDLFNLTNSSSSLFGLS